MHTSKQNFCGQRNIFAFIFLVFSLSLVSVNVSAESLSFAEDDSINIGDSDELIWGKEFLLNVSEISYNEDVLKMEKSNNKVFNITLSSNTSEKVNFTLLNYTLPNEDKPNQTKIKLKAESNNDSSINYSFTGFPSISKGNYTLRSGNTTISTFKTGGEINWSQKLRSKSQTFTITYNPNGSMNEDSEENTGNENDETNQEGLYSSGGSSSDSDLDNNVNSVKETRKWFNVDKKRFIYDQIKNPEFKKIAVNTRDNVSDLEIDFKKIYKSSTAPSIENQYGLYNIKVRSEGELSTLDFQFRVNKSFSERYDYIRLKRYNGEKWSDLPTEKVGSTGEYILYNSSAKMNSYFAIAGNLNNSQTSEQTFSNSTEKENESIIPGDDAQDEIDDTQDKDEQFNWVIWLAGLGLISGLLIALKYLALNARANFRDSHRTVIDEVKQKEVSVLSITENEIEKVRRLLEEENESKEFPGEYGDFENEAFD